MCVSGGAFSFAVQQNLDFMIYANILIDFIIMHHSNDIISI